MTRLPACTLWWLLCGCGTAPVILPSHAAVRSQFIPTGQTVPSTPFELGRPLLLVMGPDTSLAPTGADHRADGNGPFSHTLVVSQPGYVVFEAVADALERRGAKVRRQYHAYQPLPASLSGEHQVVTLSVEHLELHRFTNGGDRLAVRSTVVVETGDQRSAVPVAVAVAAPNDVFAAVGEHVAESVHRMLHARTP